MPWLIEKKWGKHTYHLEVTKAIYIQFVFSPCGPIGRLASAKRKGVSRSAVRCVLVALASRCGRPDLCCWPRIRLIAEDTGFTTNTVMEALDAAEQQGWIEIKKLAKHRMTRMIGGTRPHEYHLMLPKFDISDAKKVISGYFNHYWDTRTTANYPSRLTQSDNALSDWVRH